jgi:curved DNA-binding protein
MSESAAFVDYYDILQVSPNCQAKALETAYRFLAKKYHPDRAETADVTKFNEVIEAYRVLRDPDRRSEYNFRYAAHRADEGFSFTTEEESAGDEKDALSDAEAHAKLLQFLYKRRRENAQDAGVGRFWVQEMLNCSDEHFEFHIWYLKAKGLIEVTEQGTLAITIEGVDHVITTSRTARRERLLLAQSGEAPDQAG